LSYPGIFHRNGASEGGRTLVSTLTPQKFCFF